jgi:hypothetical protein
MQGIVGGPSSTSNADTSNPVALMGKAAELMVAELHGKYYTQSYRGNAFIGNTASGGVAITILGTTAQVFGIWNPAGNTRNAVPQTIDVGPTTGTFVVGNLVLGQSLNAGSALATGGISAFTSGTPAGGNIGLSGGNTVRFTPSAATTLANTFLLALNMVFASTALTSPNVHYDFEGGVIVPPNAAIWLNTNPTIQTQSMTASLRWEEAPV